MTVPQHSRLACRPACRPRAARPSRSRAAAAVVLATLAALLLPTAASVAAPGPPALVDEGGPGQPLVCNGRVIQQQVHRDIRVPRHGWCSLERSAVHGRVLVDPTARLQSVSSAVLGEILSSGAVTTSHTTVHGRIWLDRATFLTMTDSSVRASIRGHAVGLDLRRVGVDGAVNVTTTRETLFDNVRVDGWVNLPAGPRAIVAVMWSRLGSGLTIKDARTTYVCGTDVASDVVVTGVANEASIGVRPVLSGFWGCHNYPPPSHHRPPDAPAAQAQVVTVGGTLNLRSNAARLLLGPVEVAGDVRCEANGGRLEVGDLRVGGERTGC